MFHVAGENDPLVRYQWQKMMIDQLKELNQCEAGMAWDGKATLFPSKSGNPVDHTHYQPRPQIPAEAPPLIVKFFKEQVKPRELK